MKHILTFTLIAICFTSFSQEADTLHVPQETSSLQEAIDLVSDGGVIVLGEGTYEHGQTFVVDHKSITIQGCCSAEDVVLSGSNSHRVLDIFGDEDHAVVVQNLTIAFGRPGSDDHASALKVHDCQATFSQVIIENNGGGTGNTVAYGSGRESTLFERCIVRNNSVENYAGLRSATARKCILHGNGGWNNTAVLLDCESYNCTVFGNGGGVHASGLSGGTAKNCVFWNNSAQSTYNPESVEYCLNSGHSGEGNIEGNPLFVDADAGEFGLMPASPAVDSGDPNPIFNDADGSRNDMGAIALNEDFYVLAGCTDPLSCNYNSDVEEDDGSCLPYDALAGCVDETACNFNVDALCSDESCVYPLIAEDCESGSIACAEGTNWDATLQQCVPIESPTPCGEGTYWDAVNEECAVLMPSDANFDGCVGMIDLLDLLTVFGTCADQPSDDTNELPAVEDALYVMDNSIFNQAQEFTIAARAAFNGAESSSIIYRQIEGGEMQLSHYDGVLNFQVKASNGNCYTASGWVYAQTALADEDLHHIVATYDRTEGEISLSIDGEVRVIQSVNGGDLADCDHYEAAIGNESVQDWRLAEIGFYQFAWTADQIEAYSTCVDLVDLDFNAPTVLLPIGTSPDGAAEVLESYEPLQILGSPGVVTCE